MYISLYKGIHRADVRLVIDNTARDHRVRLRVAAGIKTDRVLSQGHLAIIERPVSRPAVTERWVQPQTQLYPCREWIAVRDAERGLAVALKGMYDYEAVNNPLTNAPDLCVTLVRGIQLMGRRNTMQRMGAASDACDTPGAQCLGVHEIEWSYIPYAPQTAAIGSDAGNGDVCGGGSSCDGGGKSGCSDIAPFLPEAQSFLYPPVAHFIRSVPPEPSVTGDETAEGTAKSAGERTCNSTTEESGDAYNAWGGFEFGAPNIQFSAFKKAADDGGYVLRFFENQGKSVNVDIPVAPFTKAYISNMNEDTLAEIDITNGVATVTAGAYKAVTVKLYK
jgi:alpha-mannosidase